MKLFSIRLSLIVLAGAIFFGAGCLFFYPQKGLLSLEKPTTHPAQINPITEQLAARPHEIPHSIVQQVQLTEAERNFRLQHLSALPKLMFYGRVTDEKGFPLENARIVVTYPDSLLVDKETAGNGTFFASGAKSSFTLTIEKDSYQPHTFAQSEFKYEGGTSPKLPYPDQPVLFILQKADRS